MAAGEKKAAAARWVTACNVQVHEAATRHTAFGIKNMLGEEIFNELGLRRRKPDIKFDTHPRYGTHNEHLDWADVPNMHKLAQKGKRLRYKKIP